MYISGKGKKETWKTSETSVSFMPNLYSHPKERFRIFFFPAGPRIIAPAGKILDEILCGQDVDVHVRDPHVHGYKCARAALRESTAWTRIQREGRGEGEVSTENRRAIFKRETFEIRSPVSQEWGTRSEIFRGSARISVTYCIS